MNYKKPYFRDLAKKIRYTLGIEQLHEKSKIIVCKIKELEVYKKATTVMSYMPKEVEVDLTGLLQDTSKKWYLPVIKESHLTSYSLQLIVVQYIPNKTKLRSGKFGILEPEISSENYFDQIDKKISLDLILVPGLCLDKKGGRIGFGKGYYDAFLKLNKKSFKIGCCPKECLMDSLPQDEWDIKVDMVITD